MFIWCQLGSTSWFIMILIEKSLLPAAKIEIGTYTTDKIKVIGSCSLFVAHPDTKCLQEVIFHVTSHEGSAVISCETSLRLSLIQPCSNLDQIPDSASLICSNADHPMKRKSKKRVQYESNVIVCLQERNKFLQSLFHKRYMLTSGWFKKFRRNKQSEVSRQHC